MQLAHYEVLFEVTTVLNKKIRVTVSHWNKIISFKHPVMKDKENWVKKTLMDPFEVRVSKSDPNVYLYYSLEGNYYCSVVVKHLNSEGFIVTAYITDKVKEGIVVWKK